MSFIQCISDNAELSESQKKSLINEYDSIVNRLTETMGDANAAALAANKMISVKTKQLVQKKKNNIRAALMQKKINTEIKTRFDEKLKEYNSLNVVQKKFYKKPTYAEEVRNFLERSHIRQQTIARQAFEEIGEFIEKNRAQWAGLIGADEVAVRKVVQEILGESTNDVEAKLFGQKIRQVFDSLHKKFETEGGILGKLDNYFPQFHSPELLKRVSFSQWRDFMLDKLDREKMINDKTGLPFTDKELIDQMKGDYEAITTNGRSELQKRADEGLQSFGFGGDVSQRRMASRFYHFKNADAFLAYNDRFGKGKLGLFDTIIGHIENMSRDIGVMQNMGPKPNALMRNLDLQMVAKKSGSTSRSWTNGMYDVLVGRTMDAGDQPVWTKVLSGTQDVMRSAYLGSAPLSAISDATFVKMTASMNGLNGTKVIGKYLSLMNPKNKTDRRLANRSGFIAEIASNTSFSGARFAEESSGTKTTRWLASFTNKASGLEAMTQAAKNAITLELQGQIAEYSHSKIAWESLPTVFRDAAIANGINKKKWQIIMKAKLFQHPERDGVTFVRPSEVANVRDGVTAKQAMDAANALDDWSFTMRNTATNEPTLRTRAITTGALFGDATPGSANRAVWSSLTMFKGFPITVLFNHTLPAFRQVSEGRLSQLGTMVIGMTVLGGIGLQMGELARGKDTRDMEDWKFWQAAMLKGGGLGIFGDFLFGDFSRLGRTPIEQVTGPVVGLATDMGRVFMGNFQRALDDPDYESNFLRDMFNSVKRNVPAGNLWYSRLMLERMLFDSVEKMVDPRYKSNQRRYEQRLKRETGQQFWWRKGETSPRRAPEIQGF